MTETQETDRIEFIHEAVAKLKYFAQLYGINSLFIVGGYCRALYFNNLNEVHDIDVASAYPQQAVELAGLFASEILNTVPVVYRQSQTAMVEYESGGRSIRIEFQGRSPAPYMHNQEIRDWMHNQKIEDEPLMHNLYGRDFTINSLIYSLQNERIYDLTDSALKDLENGQINPLLPPNLLIKYNPIAALRAIRFAVAYQFSINDDLQKIIAEAYPFIVASLSEDRISKELIRILTIDAKKALDLLKKFNLDRLLLLPLVREKIRE